MNFAASYASELHSRKLEYCDDGHTFKVSYGQLPKHKIFINHSGKQKDFAEQLCEDLERYGYYPFFDKRPHSLPKGENFPKLIFKATRECFLAIVLLSEEFFTRSKWPMLELASFVEAQKTREQLRILPVLLDLCIGDLNDTARWSEHWKNWEKHDTRLDCKAWENAVKSLRPLNMLMRSSYEGEVALRKAIVQAVLKMMPPDIQSDIAHVQGKERLYKEIFSNFFNIPASCSKVCENAKVLGIYGIGGTGKSTVCMILTHFLWRRFEGRVCHVELDEGVSTLKLQCQALKQLTGANQDYLNMHIYTGEQGLACLKERMPRQRVFLALDNVSDIAKSVEAAKMFLKPKFHLNSMVLVTSRSKDVLQRSLGIPESCCIPCPQVTAEEAREIVLDHIDFPSTGTLTEEQKAFLQQTLESCNFRDFGGFHPLSLKVLASQMGSNPPSWKLGDLQESSDIDHPLFSAIERNFSRLPDQQTRDIFMDIALFCPENVNNVHGVCMWLSDSLHSNCDINDARKKLHNLRLKSLLEVWSTDADILRIHGIHRELAKRKARVKNTSYGNPPRFVYQQGDRVISSVFSIRQLAQHIERACFVECNFTTVSFEECSRLQLLCIRSCLKLATLSLHRLLSLVSLELSSCPMKHLNLKGLVNLRWLGVDSCGELSKLNASGLEELTCVCVSRCINLEDLELARCNMLKSLSVSYNNSLMHVDASNGKSLHCLTLWFCDSLSSVHVSEYVILSEFKKRGCPQLLNLQGCINLSDDVKCLILTLWHKIPRGAVTSLAKSTRLQVLDLWDGPVTRLPDLRSCINLHNLRLSDLDVLLDSGDSSLLKEYAAILHAPAESLGLPIALQDLQIASCRNVVVKEVCWKLRGLKNLKVLSMRRVRVAWDWELYMPAEQKGSIASFQVRHCEIESLNDINKKAERFLKENKKKGKAEMVSSEEASSDNVGFFVDGDGSNEGFPGATIMDFEIFDCLCQIMDWVKEYLDHTADNSHVATKISVIIQNYRRANVVEPSMAVSENNVRCSGRTSMPFDRIRKSQYGIIERTLLETCKICDTTCEQVLKRLNVDHLTPSELENVAGLVKQFQREAAQELVEQLNALSTISPEGVLRHDDLETWEEKIIHELAMYEKVQSFGKTNDSVIWENRLMGEGILLRLPRVEVLEENLEFFIYKRGFQIRIDPVKMMAGRRDWLRSCKICMLTEQLLFLVERKGKGVVDEVEGRSLNFWWLEEMVEEIKLLLQHELEQTLFDASYHSPAVCRGMLRGWKIWQWLASCLSQDLVSIMPLRLENGEVTHQGRVRLKSLNEWLHSSSHPVTRALWAFKEGLDFLITIAEKMVELLHPHANVTWQNVERKAVALQNKSLTLVGLLSTTGRLEEVGAEFKLMRMAIYGDDLLRNLLHTRGEEVTQQERIFALDMRRGFEECIKVLSSSLKIACGCFRGDDFTFEISLMTRSQDSEDSEETMECYHLGLDFCETLAEMLREKLESIQAAYPGGESRKMWEGAMELANKLADSLAFIDGGYSQLRDIEARVLVQRKMKDIWGWAGRMPFRKKLKHMMKIEQEVMQGFVPPGTTESLLSVIKREGGVVTVPGQSAFCKLVRHFEFMEKMHWVYLVPSRLVRIVEGGEVEVRSSTGERIGRMSGLMMQHEPHPEEILKEDVLHIWRRGENFPLRKTWNNINGDQNFVLPVTDCSMLRHLHISDCLLRVPPHVQERACSHPPRAATSH